MSLILGLAFGLAVLVFVGLLLGLVLGGVYYLPVQYFSRDREFATRETNKIFLVFRNLVGLTIVVAGAILILPVFPLPPGSGAFVMLGGVLIMEFREKRRFLIRLVSLPGVFRLLNRLRQLLGRNGFEKPVELVAAEEQKK